MKHTLIFIDADRNKITAEIQVRECNGSRKFTMSGDMEGSSGQIFDHVKPATEAQKQLIQTWKDWHLNGMSSGTPEQDEIIKNKESYKNLLDNDGEIIRKLVHREFYEEEQKRVKKNLLETEPNTYPNEETVNDYLCTDYAKTIINNTIEERTAKKVFKIYEAVEKVVNGSAKYDYEAAVYLLKFENKYTVKHPETGEAFKYGHSWYTKQLPEDFESTLQALIETIEDETEQNPVTDDDLKLFEDFNNPAACLALAIMLELNISEIEDITEGNENWYTVQGIDYLCGTYEEMEEHAKERLAQYVDDCILPEVAENMQSYFDTDKWIDDALTYDGIGHTLNNWDGSELWHGDFIACRQ